MPVEIINKIPTHCLHNVGRRIKEYYLSAYQIKSNQIKFYLVTHHLQYVHFIKSDVTEEIL